MPIENEHLKWISSTDFIYQNQIDNQTFEMAMLCYKRTSDRKLRKEVYLKIKKLLGKNKHFLNFYFHI